MTSRLMRTMKRPRSQTSSSRTRRWPLPSSHSRTSPNCSTPGCAFWPTPRRGGTSDGLAGERGEAALSHGAPPPADDLPVRGVRPTLTETASLPQWRRCGVPPGLLAFTTSGRQGTAIHRRPDRLIPRPVLTRRACGTSCDPATQAAARSPRPTARIRRPFPAVRGQIAVLPIKTGGCHPSRAHSPHWTDTRSG